jgi:hypothetical protein
VLRIPYFWGLVALLGSVYLALSLAGHPVLTLCSAAVIGIVTVPVWRLAESVEEADPTSAPVVLSALATGGGALMAFAVTSATAALWASVGVGIATGCAYGLTALRGGNHACCAACRQPLAAAPASTCPRCRDVFCSRPACWDARHYRCAGCLAREVILFPIRGDWWVRHVGARATQGSCGHCCKEAHEAELHECQQCGWPLCRRCWDHLNGRCARPQCGWVLPDLPADLRRLHAAQRPKGVRASRRSQRRA